MFWVLFDRCAYNDKMRRVDVSHVLVLPEQQQPAPAIEGVFGKDWCMDLWREEKRVPSQRKETVEPTAMSSMGAQVTAGPLFYPF